jgi:hypothetical protein
MYVPTEYLLHSLRASNLGIKEMGSILGTIPDFCMTLASYLICASTSSSVNGNYWASPFLCI